MSNYYCVKHDFCTPRLDYCPLCKIENRIEDLEKSVGPEKPKEECSAIRRLRMNEKEIVSELRKYVDDELTYAIQKLKDKLEYIEKVSERPKESDLVELIMRTIGIGEVNSEMLAIKIKRLAIRKVTEIMGTTYEPNWDKIKTALEEM